MLSSTILALLAYSATLASGRPLTTNPPSSSNRLDPANDAPFNFDPNTRILDRREKEYMNFHSRSLVDAANNNGREKEYMNFHSRSAAGGNTESREKEYMNFHSRSLADNNQGGQEKEYMNFETRSVVDDDLEARAT